MVFVSKNLKRKCKYCDKEPKKNMSTGRHNGWYRTCGSKECLNAQYKDNHVCALKGRFKNIEDLTCVICGNSFLRTSSNHRKYCKECVPDKSWRGRAQRYGIGKKQWDVLLKKQNNKCALCDKNPEVVDHCHKEGIVRGLLCNACNTGLKILDSCPNFLQRSLEYVGVSNAFQK
jgi:Recombination endonuclease VII